MAVLSPRKPAANAEIVSRAADNSTEQRPQDRYPEHPATVGKPVVLESRNHGKEPWAEIARRVDGVTVQSTERHADADNDQSDQDRREISDRQVALIGDGEYEEKQQRGADHLIEKPSGRDLWEGGESSEDASGMVETRIGFLERGKVIPKHQGGSAEGPEGLNQHIREYFDPGESAKNGERKSDCGVQMRPGDFASGIDAHGDCQAPGDSDIRVAAMHRLAGNIGPEQYDHGDDATTKEDQDKGPEKFGDKFSKHA